MKVRERVSGLRVKGSDIHKATTYVDDLYLISEAIVGVILTTRDKR
ncbi:MAG TPA: hypothetical protein VM574_01795 [Terrimicrobiaceae bacterium]|jgi:hypothetical protein|nr:hypothetical protein [Terrimicrobiaceae bacterium]